MPDNNPYIVFFPTTRCDVGCRHCMHNVSMGGFDISMTLMRVLIENLKKEKLSATFCATGFGDPLLHPKFIELMDLILDDYGTTELSLITAGYSNNEPFKRNNLLELLEKNYEHRVSLILSYNKYANFDERMISFLTDLIGFSTEKFVNVKMCISQENAQETVRDFARLLVEFFKDSDLPKPEYCGVDKPFNWRNAPAYLDSRKYLLHGLHADHKIRTIHHTLSRVGRAAGLNESPWYRQRCDCLDKADKNMLILFADGFFYPCERSVGIINKRLGHIMTDSVTDVLAKKKRLVKFAERFFDPIETIFERTPCAICRYLPF